MEVVLTKFTEIRGNGKKDKFYVHRISENFALLLKIVDAGNSICRSCTLVDNCHRKYEGFSSSSIVFNGTKTEDPSCKIPKDSKGGLVLNI